MRRITTHRELADMFVPFRLMKYRVAALPPDVERAHWRSTNETGGEFDSKIRPASHVDVPHPKDLYGPEGYAKWVAKRGGEPLDPINDPWGRLDDHHNTFDQMVQNKVDHHFAQTPAEALNGRVWYKAFHDGTKAVAEKAKNKWGPDTHKRVVGIFSAFSPKTKWHKNVEHASAFLENYDGDPAKRHEWKAANIHPDALRDFRDATGRVPTDDPADMHQLADLHVKHKELQDPAGRQEWMDNIQARGGMDAALQRHTNEVLKAHKNTAVKATTNPDGSLVPAVDHEGNILTNRNGPLKARYRPAEAFTHTHPSTPTLGSSISDAKDIYNGGEAQWADVLGGRKTQSFSTNGADETPFREPREGHARDHGYYELPTDPDGTPNWTLHPDQEVTADTHDVRAIDTPANAGKEHFGAMEYKTPNWFAGGVRRNSNEVRDAATGKVHDLGYDLAHRVNWAATKKINEMEPDANRHIIPKQTQAGVWGRFKNQVDKFANKAPQDGATWWHSLKGWGPIASHFQEVQTPGAAPGVTARRRRLAGTGLMNGIGHTWPEWMQNWITEYFGQRGEHPDEEYPHTHDQMLLSEDDPDADPRAHLGSNRDIDDWLTWS